MRELKPANSFPLFQSAVAPSRVRELKQYQLPEQLHQKGRTFTGAWIETWYDAKTNKSYPVAPSRVRELKQSNWTRNLVKSSVAPSRVRELKQKAMLLIARKNGSHLHGCVNWNIKAEKKKKQEKVAPSRVRELKPEHIDFVKNKLSRTFTGAWIETLFQIQLTQHKQVAPSRVRELKHLSSQCYFPTA